MGGHDPYSASKGCAELATAVYGRALLSACRPPRCNAEGGQRRRRRRLGGGPARGRPDAELPCGGSGGHPGRPIPSALGSMCSEPLAGLSAGGRAALAATGRYRLRPGTSALTKATSFGSATSPAGSRGSGAAGKEYRVQSDQLCAPRRCRRCRLSTLLVPRSGTRMAALVAARRGVSCENGRMVADNSRRE